jgi:hypothetical protein
LAALQRRRPRLEILACAAQVLALAVSAADCDLPVARLHVLLHDDRVRALRHDSAGHDAHALTGVDRTGERRAREGGAHDLQGHLAVAFEVIETHRITVHRGVVAGRHVQRRDDVGSQHAAERRSHVHALGCRDRDEKSSDDFACLVHGHRVRIVIIGAGKCALVLERIVHL